MNIKGIIYYSFVKYGDSTGPSVNETSFLCGLDKSNINSIKICRSEKSFNEPNFRIDNIGNHFLSYMVYQIFGLLYLQKCTLKNPNYCIIFRLHPFPVAELIFTLINKHKKIFIKSLGHSLHKWKTGTIVGMINQWILKMLLERCNGIDTVTEKSKNSIINDLKIKPNIIVVDNAVDTEIFVPKDKIKSREKINLVYYDYIIGYTGNYPLVRGGKEVIYIVDYLRNTKKINCAGLILGDDIGIKQLKELTKCRGLTKKIIYPGRVPYCRVPMYISALDIGVSCLPPNKDAASGQKVRQYTAMGIAVISTQKNDIFIEKIKIGKIVDYDNIDKICNNAYELLTQKIPVNKAHMYAVNNLSTEKQLKTRLKYWSLI